MRILIFIFIALFVLGVAWFIFRPKAATPRYRIQVSQPIPAQAPRETGPLPRDRANN